MDIQPSRRSFLKTSSTVAAGALFSTSIARTAHAAGDDQIRFVVVGCGGRGTGAADQIMNTKGNTKLVAVADAFERNAEQTIRSMSGRHKDKVDVPQERIFTGLDAYKKAIDVDCDLVVIATPPGFKPQQFEYAVSKGRHVFMEKPVAVDAPGTRRVLAAVEESKKKNLTVAIGLQRRLAEAARDLDLVVISDEIYRDLVHDPATVVHSPAEFAPERTVVSTGLSKNLALGGWRIGVARLPHGERGRLLHADLLGIASEIWSSPSGPVQRAAAYAFGEPPEIVDLIDRSRRLHGAVAHAVADRFRAAGATVVAPQAAFYLYPDFGAWRERLAAEHGVTSGPDLTRMLLDRYGMGVLPAAEFGESVDALRMRVATSLLYGETEAQRASARAAEDPVALPWIRAHLDRLSEVLDDVGSEQPTALHAMAG